MVDMSMIIAGNIFNALKKQQKKQIDLANAIGTNKQTVNKMLNGTRMISAIELKSIAKYLGVPMEDLTRIPSDYEDVDVVHVFMGKVQSDEAKRALQIADEISDMIIFHKSVRENAESMLVTWGED